MARCVVLLCALSLGFAPLPFPKPPKPATGFGLPALQGKWERTSLLINGNLRPPGTGMTITGDVMAFGSASDSWRLVLGAPIDPRAFSAARLDGSMVFRGVCRLEGDTLTVCWRDGAEKDRATSFDPKQPGVWLQVFRRTGR